MPGGAAPNASTATSSTATQPRRVWLPPLRYSLPVIMLVSGLVLICAETALFLASGLIAGALPPFLFARLRDGSASIFSMPLSSAQPMALAAAASAAALTSPGPHLVSPVPLADLPASLAEAMLHAVCSPMLRIILPALGGTDGSATELLHLSPTAENPHRVVPPNVA